MPWGVTLLANSESAKNDDILTLEFLSLRQFLKHSIRPLRCGRQPIPNSLEMWNIILHPECLTSHDFLDLQTAFKNGLIFLIVNAQPPTAKLKAVYSLILSLGL